MNKYMGFYELKALNLPSVNWQLFTLDTELDPQKLWTVRVAVENGNDLNLPRAVGVLAQEAFQKGRSFLEEYAGKGIVIYYPYFIAEKSGVLETGRNRTVIEAVNKDLWNLVTHGRKNITVIISDESEDGRIRRENFICLPDDDAGTAGRCKVQYFGNEEFLDKNEISELLKYSTVIRSRFREKLSEGKSILAEWSYAYDTDIRREPASERYLVFYELREI